MAEPLKLINGQGCDSQREDLRYRSAYCAILWAVEKTKGNDVKADAYFKAHKEYSRKCNPLPRSALTVIEGGQ